MSEVAVLRHGGGSVQREMTAIESGDIGSLVSSLRRMIAVELNAEECSDLEAEDRRELARELASERFRRFDAELVASGSRPLEPAVQARVTQAVLDALFGLGQLQSLIDDPTDREHRRQRMRSGLGHVCRRQKALMEPVADTDAELVELLRLRRGTLRALRTPVRHGPSGARSAAPRRQPAVGPHVGRVAAVRLDPAAPLHRSDDWATW